VSAVFYDYQFRNVITWWIVVTCLVMVIEDTSVCIMLLGPTHYHSHKEMSAALFLLSLCVHSRYTDVRRHDMGRTLLDLPCHFCRRRSREIDENPVGSFLIGKSVRQA